MCTVRYRDIIYLKIDTKYKIRDSNFGFVVGSSSGGTLITIKGRPSRSRPPGIYASFDSRASRISAAFKIFIDISITACKRKSFQIVFYRYRDRDRSEKDHICRQYIHV